MITLLLISFFVFRLFASPTTTYHCQQSIFYSEKNKINLCPCMKDFVSTEVSDIDITIVSRSGDWILFRTEGCENFTEIDSAYGYAHLEKGKWIIKAFGTAIDEDEEKSLNLPTNLYL